jgi:hypothetical protein
MEHPGRSETEVEALESLFCAPTLGKYVERKYRSAATFGTNAAFLFKIFARPVFRISIREEVNRE